MTPILSVVGHGAAAGAMALLTPCVFPMVPITVSYFTRDTAPGRRHTARNAFVFGLGIITTFTALGLALAVFLGATGVNRFAANPWVNLAIAGLFVLFAFHGLLLEEGRRIFQARVRAAPLPTKITVPQGQPFSLAGEIASDGAAVKFDPNFDLEVQSHEVEVNLEVPLSAAADADPGVEAFKVNARFQACDATMYLPAQTEKLTVPVKVASKPQSASATR